MSTTPETNAKVIKTSGETSTRQTVTPSAAAAAAASIPKQTSKSVPSRSKRNKKDGEEDVSHILLNAICFGDWESSELAISLFPNQVKMWKEVRSRNGKVMIRSLPIHFALKHKAPLEVVEKLVLAHPGSLAEPNDKSRLPMHLLCQTYVSHGLSLLKLFLKVYSQAAVIRDRMGMLPFHVLAKSKSYKKFDVEVRRKMLCCLLKAYPAAAEDKDSGGNEYSNIIEEIKFEDYCDETENDNCTVHEEEASKGFFTSLKSSTSGTLNIPHRPETTTSIIDTNTVQQSSLCEADRIHKVIVKSIIKQHWKAVNFSIKMFPDQCRRRTEDIRAGYESRDLLLHLALKHGAPLNVIQALVRLYPKACVESNEKGRTPLHLACLLDVPWSFDVVKELCDVCPSAAAAKDVDVMLPLHLAMINSHKQKKNDKNESHDNIYEEEYSSFMFAENKWNSIQLLLKVNEAGASEVDKCGRCFDYWKRNSNEYREMSKLFAKKDNIGEEEDEKKFDESAPHNEPSLISLPSSTTEKAVSVNRSSMTNRRYSMGNPIQITNELKKFDKNYHALLNEIYIGNWKTASLSLSLFPEQARDWKEVKNRAGNIILRSLPIHFAIKVNAPLNFLDALLDAYPESAFMECEKGRLPLHLACGMPSDWTEHVVRRLIRMYPHGAQTPDNLGMLPLHLAAKNVIASNRKIIQMLLIKAYPEGEEIQDKQGRTFKDMTVSCGSKLCLRNTYANHAPPTALRAHEDDGTNKILTMYKSVLQKKLLL